MLSAAPPPFVVAARVRAVRPACPDAPVPAAGAASAALPARCPALDVTGHVGAGDVSLDPAFDLIVPSAQLVRADPTGNVTLTAYGADGATLFALPFVARDTFHVDVPVSPVLASAIRRIRLTSAVGTAERTATLHGEPTAEIVGTGDRDAVVAWNALAFPAIRLTTDSEPAATIARGQGTYEQTTVATVSRFVTIDFSDGVRSVSRRYRVFGR